MLIFNGTEYRNLEEQVLKNKEDIAKHYEIDRALANLGIKVVGQVELPSQLPDPLTYQGEFGDTYAVGNPEDVAEGTGYYSYYVFTRPDENAGTTTNHWLNVGRISIVGPQGPEGPKGEQGKNGESSRWYYGSSGPVAGEDYEYQEGDMWLDGAGNVYRYDGGLWKLTTNIKGPQGVQGIRGPQGERGEQGPQGQQGPQGDVGGFINIWGNLANVNQLPTPTSLNNLTAAYLVVHPGEANHYDLYIQVGSTPAEAVWINAGPFNVATLVTQGGVGLNVWDSDTKLDKKTNATDFRELYIKNANGTQGMISAAEGIMEAGNIPIRSIGGSVLVPRNPNSDWDAVSKAYVDGATSTKLEKDTSTTYYNQVYVKEANGGQGTINVAKQVVADAVVQRQSDGNIYVPGSPVEGTDAASKAYVDSKIGSGGGIYAHEFFWEEEMTAQEHSIKFYTTKSSKYNVDGEDYASFDNLMEDVIAIRFLEDWYDIPYYSVLNLYFNEDEGYVSLYFTYADFSTLRRHNTGGAFGKTFTYTVKAA